MERNGLEGWSLASGGVNRVSNDLLMCKVLYDSLDQCRKRELLYSRVSTRDVNP